MGKMLAMQVTQLASRTMQIPNLATSIAKQNCKQSSKEQGWRHQWDWCYPEQAKRNIENRQRKQGHLLMQVTHTHAKRPILDNKIGIRTTNKAQTKSMLPPLHPMLNTYIKHTATGGAGIWLQVLHAGIRRKPFRARTEHGGRRCLHRAITK